MLTPFQLRKIYFDTVKELYPRSWPMQELGLEGNEAVKFVSETPYPELNENSKLTQEQWNNLVNACRFIKENQNRFRMESWHDESSCGTTHCIAGTAVAQYMQNLDFDSDKFSLPEFVNAYDFSNCTTRRESENVNSVLATVLLSEYVSPFFYLSETEDWEDSSSVIMKNLIERVLSEVERDH